MRIIAVFRAEGWGDGAVDRFREAFSRHSLIESGDPIESRDIIAALTTDMPESALYRFQQTVRFVARHAVGETVASLSVLSNGDLLVRLRNPQLHQLMPDGHVLISDLLSESDTTSERRLHLTHCEVRERGGGHSEGFLFGEWRGGGPGLLPFIYGHRKSYFVWISLLFCVGLGLEVSLAFLKSTHPLAELGRRLGAPMLVSSSVLIMERIALWFDQRTPSLRWTPIRRSERTNPLDGTASAPH